MSEIAVSLPATTLNPMAAKAILPLSPSFTGWKNLQYIQLSSLSLENNIKAFRNRSPSLASNFETVDLTLDDEAEEDLAVVNQPSSLPTQVEAVDVMEDSHLISTIPPDAVDLREEIQPILFDLQRSSRVSSLSEKSSLEQTIRVDSTKNLLGTCDTMIIPKKHCKQSGQSSQSSAVNLPASPWETERTPSHHEHSGIANSTPTRTRTELDHSASAPGNDPDETDIDEPMPRLLPKFAPRSLFDLTEEDENSTEDDNEDVITKEELRTWLLSQAGRDSAFETYGVSVTPSSKAKVQSRNLPIEHPFYILDTYTYSGIILRKGVHIELRDTTFAREDDRKGVQNGPHNSFMRIVDIIQDTRSKAVTLRGWIFQRASYLNGILEKKRNEVCWVMHVDEDDKRDMKIQSMETVPVKDVVRRRKIRLTNQPWPNLSFREDEHVLEDSEETIRNERVLVCRFMYICHYVCAQRREANCWSERCLQRLRHDDCDGWAGTDGQLRALDDGELRKVWRGETSPGGAYVASSQTDNWYERMVNIARKRTVDLTSEILEYDPEVAALSHTSRHKGHPFRVTGVATRVDWTTPDGTEHYTINGCVPPKRSADEDLSPESSKRHRKPQFTLKAERPPPTISMVEKLRRKSSVVEVAPWNSIPRPTEPHLPYVQASNISNISNNCTSTRKRQYTFGDSFCGAGGMSRAAHQLDLNIKYAFDCNKHACNTYTLNFPGADLHCLWAHDFVQQKADFKVDIAHLSPPCQFFSDAHTVAGKDDEMNTASLFAVGELLKKSKPRVVTLEQTFGILLRARHQGYLNALVQVFTSAGFSTRWRLLHCADYGLPQMRLRTFMIASWYANFQPPPFAPVTLTDLSFFLTAQANPSHPFLHLRTPRPRPLHPICFHGPPSPQPSAPSHPQHPTTTSTPLSHATFRPTQAPRSPAQSPAMAAAWSIQVVRETSRSGNSRPCRAFPTNMFSGTSARRNK